MEQQDINIGRVIENRYELSELVGSGATSDVYRAFDREMKRTVAVKVFKEEAMNDSEAKKRFINETKAFTLLDSNPNIISIYDVYISNKTQCIVMEYAPGIDLKKYIAGRKNRLTVKEALNVTVQVLNALAFAHSKGVVHRDIKPQNIMLLEDGRIKLTDFGIALIPGIVETEERAVGTIYYMSPEQVYAKNIDCRADIYSLGIMIYEMICGVLPFYSENIKEVPMMLVCETPVAPSIHCPSIPPAVEQIILKAINKKPDNRFDSCEQMLAYINMYLETPNIMFDFEIDDDGFDVNAVLPSETEAVNFVPEQGKTLPSQNTKKNTKKSRRKSVHGAGKPAGKAKKSIGATGYIAVSVALMMMVFALGAFYVFDRYIYADDGMKTVSVGNYVGMVYDDEMANRLESDGFEVSVIYRYENDRNFNTVLSQSLAANAIKQVPDGTAAKLELVLCGGIVMTPLGDYGGADGITAYDELEQSGYAVVLIYEPSSEDKRGTVIKTEPEKNTPIRNGDEVKLYIGVGATEYTTVPQLVGKSSKTAVSLLIQSGITLGALTTDYSESVGSGCVIWQSRLAGEQVPVEGTSVDIKISRGKRPE